MFESIVLIKLRDQCLDSKSLSRYVDSAFTSMQYFPAAMKEAFTVDAEDRESVTFEVLLFYTCIYWVRDEINPRVFLEILSRIRTFLFFTSQNPSILTREEDDYSFDLIEACLDISTVSIRDLKKQVISLIHRIPSSDDVEAGRQLFDCDDDTIALFVSHYLGSDKIYFTFQKAVSGFLSLLHLFHRMGFPIVPRLSGRMRKVKLMRDMIMKGIVQQAPVVENNNTGRILFSNSQTMFTRHLENFSNTCSPRARKKMTMNNTQGTFQNETDLIGAREDQNIVEASFMAALPEAKTDFVTVPYAEKNIDSTETPITSSNSLKTDIRAPETLSHIPEFRKQLVQNSLIGAGMSPTKSTKVAEQFVDGGSPNRRALDKVVTDELEQSISKLESLVGRMERRKMDKSQLGEIKELLLGIKSVTN